MGAILVEKLPLYLIDLEYLLDLWNPSGHSVDVEHFVRRLRAVLVDGDGEICSQTKPRVHRSFSNFVTSRYAGWFRVLPRDLDRPLHYHILFAYVIGGVVGGRYADSWIYVDVDNRLLITPKLGGLIILK